MFVAALVGLALVGSLIFALVHYADSLPKPFLSFFGYFLLVGSVIELFLLAWVLAYIVFGGAPWDISTNEFWRVKLSRIYFVKQWLYSWAWNDMLNFFLGYLPALFFLSLRTIGTTLVGLWSLAAARR
jgi:hypothetical protein